MSDKNPLKPEATAVNGWRIPAHGRGRLRPFQPGQSGNPGGVAGRYGEVVRLAREASPRALKILTQIMDDPAEETRCRLVAIEQILGRAFGKIPAEVRGVPTPGLDLESVSEAKLDLVIRALEAARDAKRAQGEGAG